MTITILQTISNTMTESRKIITSTTSETFMLTPDEKKVLRNKKTGFIINGKVWVNKRAQIEDYEEISLPEEKEN